MIKRFYFRLIPTIVAIFLTSCTIDWAQFNDTDKETEDEISAICRDLNFDMIFYKRDPNSSAKYTTDEQKERLEQLYKENDCHLVLEKKSSD